MSASDGHRGNESSSIAGVGSLIRYSRKYHGWSLAKLADKLEMTQTELTEVEEDHAAADPDLLVKASRLLADSAQAAAGQMHLRVRGACTLAGSIDVKTSKNSGVGLLCASLLNTGRTVLRNVARIEEVSRICEVLSSIGVRIRWLSDEDLEVIRPAVLELERIDKVAARRTRSVLMFFGPLVRELQEFALPYAGGCHLGTRTIEPHLIALRPFGLEVTATRGYYYALVKDDPAEQRTIVLTERGDTVTENAIMAAARSEAITTIRNASCNYAIQDLCYFLNDMGVRIDGVGTTSITIHGKAEIKADVDYALSEDPIEAMSLLTAAVVTSSELTIRRVPIEFFEIELAVLTEMGLCFNATDEYPSHNGRTRLVDLTVYPSRLHAPIDKIHPMPFPGLNIDNLPFFALIAVIASGSTLIQDWVYDNRAIYLTELTRLGARVTLMDPHRLYVEGPTRWSAADMMCPPALRPAVVLLLAMLACPGTSTLRNIYVINRGYEQLANRLNNIGAEIEIFHD